MIIQDYFCQQQIEIYITDKYLLILGKMYIKLESSA